MRNREVFLFYLAAFPKPAQFSNCFFFFANENNSAGLAIQPVYKVSRCFRTKVEENAADQARIFVCFGWMTNQSSGLVNYKQFRVFMKNFEEPPLAVSGKNRVHLRRSNHGALRD